MLICAWIIILRFLRHKSIFCVTWYFLRRDKLLWTVCFSKKDVNCSTELIQEVFFLLTMMSLQKLLWTSVTSEIAFLLILKKQNFKMLCMIYYMNLYFEFIKIIQFLQLFLEHGNYKQSRVSCILVKFLMM